MTTTLHAPEPEAVVEDSELAQLLRSFNDVTAKLQGTHESLRSEVARLERELGEAKDQLRRSRQLAALGEMAAGIAHEIRNPLGSIKLYASVLASDLADQPEERDLASKIDRAVTRLNAVVGDVLMFARELRVQPEVCDPSELFAEALDACADLWAAHAVTIDAPCGGSGFQVIADRSLVHQALVNVIRNAAEAISESRGPAPLDEHGERLIELRAEVRRALDADGQGTEMVVLRVRDSGPGVPAGVLGRVFNPFFTTRHTGTGLGLAIVHRIVDAHGGRVVIRNNDEDAPQPETAGSLGRGATVEILLPARGPGHLREEVGA